MVGLIPLFAVTTHRAGLAGAAARTSGARLEWFLRASAGAGRDWSRAGRSRAWASGACWRWLRGHRMKRVLARMLDETEFLSPYGVRALSQLPPGPPVHARRRRHALHRPVPAGRVEQRPVRRQLELARPDLVPGQLPDRRVAPAVPPLLRRRLQGRVPDRLGPVPDPERDRDGAGAAPGQHLPARRARAGGRSSATRSSSSTTRTGAT